MNRILHTYEVDFHKINKMNRTQKTFCGLCVTFANLTVRKIKPQRTQRIFARNAKKNLVNLLPLFWRGRGERLKIVVQDKIILNHRNQINQSSDKKNPHKSASSVLSAFKKNHSIFLDCFAPLAMTGK